MMGKAAAAIVLVVIVCWRINDRGRWWLRWIFGETVRVDGLFCLKGGSILLYDVMTH